jgi:AcrR family transcriptional regulator
VTSSARARTKRTAEDTRTLLIDTAIRLWAERGVEAVSLREIGSAAGQRNTGVINYYFGDRDGLMQAVVQRFAQLHPDFEANAARHLPPEGAATAHQVAVALVRPFALLLDDAADYAQLIGRFYADYGRLQNLTDLAEAKWFQAVEALAEQHLGLAPSSARWQFAITLTVHAIAAQARDRQDNPVRVTAEFVEELVGSVAAVLGGSGAARPS